MDNDTLQFREAVIDWMETLHREIRAIRYVVVGFAALTVFGFVAAAVAAGS